MAVGVAADAGAPAPVRGLDTLAGARYSTTESGGSVSFDPGLIVSDDSFFDYFAMSAGQVQRFLERHACEPRGGAPCLAGYRQDTPDRPDAGAGQCGAYRGGKSERASRIIWKVATACRISERTLLVLLQKEQSLVTHPSPAGYAKATGYGCPDTADCNAAYLGFFNQVYRAAWQFRQYTRRPSAWRYHVGTVLVQYHPDASCGASRVRIRDQATANLYNYTPYQPNAQTLAHPDGPAGACSAYGNLNFSRIWTQWFGSPLRVRLPDWLPDCLRFVNGLSCSPLELPAQPGVSQRPASHRE